MPQQAWHSSQSSLIAMACVRRPTANIMTVRMHTLMALRMHVHDTQIEPEDGRMDEVPKAQRGAVKRTCWTLGFGGASCVGTLAMMHGPGAPAAIAIGVVAAFAYN